jgi:hypothetical protein
MVQHSHRYRQAHHQSVFYQEQKCKSSAILCQDHFVEQVGLRYSGRDDN